LLTEVFTVSLFLSSNTNTKSRSERALFNHSTTSAYSWPLWSKDCETDGQGNTPLHLNNIIVNGRPKPGQGAFSDLCMELGKEKIEVEHSERFQLAARH
jgi:hypothetical protein